MSYRKLTLNEINFARKVFGGSILYINVKIYNEKYAFFQPDYSGMTPNGNIYIHGEVIGDYGKTTISPDSKAFFIHEMVHVWQKHNGVLNPIVSAIANSIRHGFNYNKAYEYTLDTEKDLLDYRMEQQAQIIEDWVRVTLLDWPIREGYLQNEEADGELRKLYESVLKRFIENPSFASKE